MALKMKRSFVITNILIFLIQNAYAMDTPQENRNAQLLTAAFDGKSALVKTLLENGADVNTRDKFQRTPLMHAAINGRTETCKVLIAAGADIATRTDIGATALTFCYSLSPKDTYNYLVDHQQEVNARIITALLCLHRMKIEGNACAQFLYRYFTSLLEPSIGKYHSIATLNSFRKHNADTAARVKKCAIQ